MKQFFKNNIYWQVPFLILFFGYFLLLSFMDSRIGDLFSVGALLALSLVAFFVGDFLRKHFAKESTTAWIGVGYFTLWVFIIFAPGLINPYFASDELYAELVGSASMGALFLWFLYQTFSVGLKDHDPEK